MPLRSSTPRQEGNPAILPNKNHRSASIARLARVKRRLTGAITSIEPNHYERLRIEVLLSRANDLLSRDRQTVNRCASDRSAAYQAGCPRNFFVLD
jgi:hypothetical protein